MSILNKMNLHYEGSMVKKTLLLLMCAVILMFSACSKDAIQENEAPAQTDTENKKDQPSEVAASDQDEEEAEETAANADEEGTSEEDNADENTSEEDKDYLTSHHQFVASELTNLSEKEVNSMWGEPVRTEEIQFRYSGTSKFVPAVVHYYENEKYAVTFVEGKAARLVYSVIDEEILFDDEKTKALELAGLPADVEEATDTDTAFVWNDIGGVYEVTMFSKGEFADYLYIILDEAYK
jgi:cytoskeletal protein RodZ